MRLLGCNNQVSRVQYSLARLRMVDKLDKTPCRLYAAYRSIA